MNFKFPFTPKCPPLADQTLRWLRGVALRVVLHEGGVLLCACAPWVHRAGEALQRHGSDHSAAATPPPTSTATNPYTYPRSSYDERGTSHEEPSAFDF